MPTIDYRNFRPASPLQVLQTGDLFTFQPINTTEPLSITYGKLLEAFSGGSSSVLSINKGGTGSNTQQTALNNLLPSQTGQDGKALVTSLGIPTWQEILKYINNKAQVVGVDGYIFNTTKVDLTAHTSLIIDNQNGGLLFTRDDSVTGVTDTLRVRDAFQYTGLYSNGAGGTISSDLLVDLNGLTIIRTNFNGGGNEIESTFFKTGNREYYVVVNDPTSNSIEFTINGNSYFAKIGVTSNSNGKFNGIIINSATNGTILSGPVSFANVDSFTVQGTLKLPNTVPATPTAGMVYYNTTNNKPLYHNGIAIVDFSYQRPKVLIDVASILLDASTSNYFRVTLTANRSLANPTNPVDAQEITLEVKQDATGSRTLSYGTAYSFGTDIPSVTLTTIANKIDYIKFRYNLAALKWHVIDVKKGY